MKSQNRRNLMSFIAASKHVVSSFVIFMSLKTVNLGKFNSIYNLTVPVKS